MMNEDLTRLLAHAVDLARKMVDAEGTLAPFAVTVGPDGILRTVAVQGTTPAPRLLDLVEGLVASLRQTLKRKPFRAAALCVPGHRTRPETGEYCRAILVSLETQDGSASAVAIPYSRGLFDSVLYHDPLEQPGKPVVFGERSGNAPGFPWRTSRPD